MKKSRIGLLVAAALCVSPVSAWAQEDAEEAPAEGEETGAPPAGQAPAEEPELGDVSEDELIEDLTGGGAEGGDVGEGGLESICDVDPEACPELDMAKEARKPLIEQIYAVQQIFALRVRRFEFNPYWIALTLNDQFVSHPGPGLAINYYITNVLAVGINGNYYQPFNVDSDFNANVRRAARVAVPLTEYQWSAAANASYVFAYGKFAGFGDFIFHYDAYLTGGVGAISTRPIPVIDPDNRDFDWEPKLAFNAGVGLRIFFNRWFAAMLEVRDYAFNEELENLEIADTREGRQDPETWFGDNEFTNNVQAQVGVSIFVPFSFDYRLPK